mmetsp:Transcript_583/g.1362  ORF Transcript_583/g.1362 Transcript_583/m.1362 type:complete len:326 (+) Transcript_583:21-998(+)
MVYLDDARMGSIYPECSIHWVTSLLSLMIVLYCSGIGISTKSSPPGMSTFIWSDLDVTTSQSRHSLDSTSCTPEHLSMTTVGTLPTTCTSALLQFTRSTLATQSVNTSAVRSQPSKVMALTLVLMLIKLFLQPKMYTTSLVAVGSMTTFLFPSWYSTTHLLPSSAHLGVPIFLPAAALGAAALALAPTDEGTTAERSSGFLFLVFSWSCTLRRPDVTAVPLLSWLKRAPMSGPLAPPLGAALRSPVGGGGGGGPPAGGGGGPPAAGLLAAGAADSALPPLGFQVRPVVWYFLMYLGSSVRKATQALAHETWSASLSLNSIRILFV